eukprot:TRINITY_DN7535_c3_g1_i1.p1 TRINITY_DN7535_c3_g1~~TRINITY_DN7535_c3_g1_i1.p1  ORF type:complete len:383 (-),score=78.72 TRINITY_DN7535_c3_g1_i1:165-1313(-)
MLCDMSRSAAAVVVADSEEVEVRLPLVASPTNMKKGDVAACSDTDVTPLGKLIGSWCLVGYRRLWFAFAGVLAIIGSIGLIAVSEDSGGNGRGNPTVRELIHSPQLHRVMTRNIATVHGKDTAAAVVSVAAGIRRLEGIIRDRTPKLSTRMDRVQLTSSQHAAVLRAMESLSDARFLRVGRDISRAALEATLANEDGKAMGRRVLAKLRPRLEEMRTLRDEYFPHARGGPADLDSGDEARMLLAFQHTDLARDFRGGASGDRSRGLSSGHGNLSALSMLAATTASEERHLQQMPSVLFAEEDGMFAQLKALFMTLVQHMKNMFSPGDFALLDPHELRQPSHQSLMQCLSNAMETGPLAVFECPMEEVVSCFQYLMVMFGVAK